MEKVGNSYPLPQKPLNRLIVT